MNFNRIYIQSIISEDGVHRQLLWLVSNLSSDMQYRGAKIHARPISGCCKRKLWWVNGIL